MWLFVDKQTISIYFFFRCRRSFLFFVRPADGSIKEGSCWHFCWWSCPHFKISQVANDQKIEKKHTTKKTRIRVYTKERNKRRQQNNSKKGVEIWRKTKHQTVNNSQKKWIQYTTERGGVVVCVYVVYVCMFNGVSDPELICYQWTIDSEGSGRR